MKLIKVLTKIINEARTETDPLWFRVPSKAVDEMGIKLYFDSDDAYVVEVQFDTQMVVIQLFTKFIIILGNRLINTDVSDINNHYCYLSRKLQTSSHYIPILVKNTSANTIFSWLYCKYSHESFENPEDFLTILKIFLDILR